MVANLHSHQPVLGETNNNEGTIIMSDQISEMSDRFENKRTKCPYILQF